MIRTIRYDEAIRVARSLIGTPYGSGKGELDCINLIKKVIRTAPGGVKTYTTAGTNALWNSYGMSAKYKDLTWRQEGIGGAMPGMLVFKRDGSDVHHVGIVTEAGTVIHASSALGETAETPLDASWHLLAIHRDIETAQDTEGEDDMSALYRARVVTEGGALNIRQVAEIGKVIGQIPNGDIVYVYSVGDWPRVRYGDTLGYASARYLQKIDEDEQGGADGEFTTLVRDDGVIVVLAGRWTANND